jgi:hypothetical protein
MIEEVKKREVAAETIETTLIVSAQATDGDECFGYEIHKGPGEPPSIEGGSNINTWVISRYCRDCSGVGFFPDKEEFTITCPDCQGSSSIEIEELEAEEFAEKYQEWRIVEGSELCGAL